MNLKFIDRAAKYTRIQELREAQLYPYFREIQSEQGTEVMIDNQTVLMFGSNSYLGLTNHPKIKEASSRAIAKYGSGCGGSRFLNGTLSIHVELEHALAEYLQQEAVVLHSTGFQANIGTLPALAGRHDFVFLDEQVHASIIDASRLTLAKVMKFRHNDMNDLEFKISQLNHDHLKFIVVDGIYSMDGDIADIPGLRQIAAKHNGVIVCDDAHALGVIGEMGIGTASHFNMLDAVDIQIGTFSKSLASLGGFVAASHQVIEYLKHTSRSIMFSASMTPAATASVLAALEIIRDEPERLAQLWTNTRYALQHLKDLGFDIGNTSSAIIPLFIRDNDKTFMMANNCLRDGVFVNPIVSPAVDPIDSMLRISVMATHTPAQIDRLVEVIYKNALKLEIAGVG